MTAFLTVGFRPFYLGASLFAALAIPLWVAIHLTGNGPATSYPEIAWHQHEMLFGFAPAVIGGFLLTAVRNWTGLPTASGALLGLLFGLWAAARILPFTGPAALAALVDLAFLPALALCLAIPLWRARNARNAFVIVILLVLWLCNLAFHAAWLRWTDGIDASRGAVVAMDAILLLITVIGGRIIPAFSANAVRSIHSRKWPALEHAAIGSVIAIAVLDVFGDRTANGPAATWYTALVYAAAAAHLLRLAGWQPWKIRSNALLLILPVSYLWVPIHLLLRGALGDVPGTLNPPSVHALVVGAMAGLMLAMMTRSALGHTGRPLRAGVAELVCFASIHTAAIVRVAGPLLVPQYPATALVLSAVLWSLAFATFAAAYAPSLVQRRLDDPAPV